jgi:hypothetical protein
VSEPDKAILWARERAARWQDESGGEAGPSYRSGKLDFLLGEEVEGYRAGQAASAERIKALEEAIREAMRRLNEYADMTVDEWDDSVADGGIMAWMVIRQELKTVVVYRLDRALLKEADQ